MGIAASYFSKQLTFTQLTRKGKGVLSGLKARKKTQQNKEKNSANKGKTQQMRKIVQIMKHASHA